MEEDYNPVCTWCLKSYTNGRRLQQLILIFPVHNELNKKFNFCDKEKSVVRITILVLFLFVYLFVFLVLLVLCDFTRPLGFIDDQTKKFGFYDEKVLRIFKLRNVLVPKRNHNKYKRDMHTKHPYRRQTN